MHPAPLLQFDGFSLDLENTCLWKGSSCLPLRPKESAVLHYLLTYPGRLVPKRELLQAVWPNTAVGDAVLKVCIQRLRQVLGEDPKTPRFIETVHRHGYRFLGTIRRQETRVARPLSASKDHRTDTLELQSSGRSFPIRHASPTSTLVGREEELAHLHHRLEQAYRGERQIVFITGEPGIGKTTLVDAFVDRIAARGELWITYGQCVEQYGAGEAYRPILEALNRLYRTQNGDRLLPLLRQYAPTWIAQMPWLLSESEYEKLQPKLRGATPERMLREFAEAMEILSTDTLVILVLDDLHWSDHATLDLLTVLARRREPARLLVLGTYRPMEVLGRSHPLPTVVQELRVHKCCVELPLRLLSEAAVEQYLTMQFPGWTSPAGLAQWLHQRTEGNPLFLVTMVEHLLAQGRPEGREKGPMVIDDLSTEIPETLRQTITLQCERLRPEERQILEVGSVAGVVFSTEEVATGLAIDLVEVETRCEGLVHRQHFLQRQEIDTWPDGTLTARYGFLHALYQQVVYEHVSPIRKQRLHHQLGMRLERGYGERVREIAAVLAMHFERGRDYQRAVLYRYKAAENALQQHAYQEAIHHLTRGLELVQTWPDSPTRTQQELRFLITLGVPLVATKGYGAPEVERTYSRARALCQHIADSAEFFLALRGLWNWYLLKAELMTAFEFGAQILRLAQRQQDAALLVEAYRVLGSTLFFRGEFLPAQSYLEQGSALYDQQHHQALAFRYGADPGIVCRLYTAWILCLTGYPDQALQRVYEALHLAQELAHPFTLAFAMSIVVDVHHLRREQEAIQKWAEAVIALSTEQGIAQWLANGLMERGWALVEQGYTEEGKTQIQEGLTAWQNTGANLAVPYRLFLLAEVYGKIGELPEGLRLLDEALALVEKQGERWWEAELYRLKGELLLWQVRGERQNGAKGKGRKRETVSAHSPSSYHADPVSQAETCFRQALAITHRQQAKSLELRAALSLSRLWQQQGKPEAARHLLAEIYQWFTEGFDTGDLREARALLEELA